MASCTWEWKGQNIRWRATESPPRWGLVFSEIAVAGLFDILIKPFGRFLLT